MLANSIVKLILGVLISMPLFMAKAEVYYVDNASGSDANEGGYEAPWRTLNSLKMIYDKLKAGDTIYLKNTGHPYKGQIKLDGVNGQQGKEVLISSYGNGLATIRSKNGSAILIYRSSNIIIKKLNLIGAGKGPCIKIGHGSSYITIIDNNIITCRSNGIFIGHKVNHTKIIRNTINKINRNDGITIHEINWGKRKNTGAFAGNHHVIMENRFLGPFHEDAIDVTSKGVTDVKIIGNYISNAERAGINIKNAKEVVIVSNKFENLGTGMKAAAIKIVGKETGKVLVQKNQFRKNRMYELLVSGGDVELSDNEIRHYMSTRAMLLYSGGALLRVDRNILINGAGVKLLRLGKADANDGLHLENNIYNGDHGQVDAACRRELGPKVKYKKQRISCTGYNEEMWACQSSVNCDDILLPN